MTFDKETIPGGFAGPPEPQDGAQAQLVCFEGCRKTVDLATPELSIGRQSDNGLVLESDRVSRHHARVLLVGRDYYIEDLGSVNGTALNGRRLAAHLREPLRHKDVVQLCGYKMLFLEWSGYAKKLGLQTIRLDSDAIRREAEEILKDFL